MNNDVMECYPVEVQELYNVFSSQTSTDMEIVVWEVNNLNTVWVATVLMHKLIVCWQPEAQNITKKNIGHFMKLSRGPPTISICIYFKAQ